jgi:hypothetical protein
MPDVTIWKREFPLKPGEPVTEEDIKAVMAVVNTDLERDGKKKLDYEIQESIISGFGKNQAGSTVKIQKGDEEMSELSIENIQKYDANLRNASIVAKSERPSQETALDFMGRYSDQLRKRFPEMTVQKANATFLKDCPTLGRLASGNSFPISVGHY